MRIDPDDLRRHYQSLPDEEFSALDPDELTAEARKLYEEELARRQPAETGRSEVASGGTGAAVLPEEIPDDAGRFDIDDGPEPDWLEDAASACAFATSTGSADVPQALRARAVLRAVGIPCYFVLSQEEPSQAGRQERHVLSVMVPGALNLHATSVLDRYVFNEEQEADWRAHLESLSDSELHALKPEIFCAGLLDRVERLRRAYEAELARRGE